MKNSELLKWLKIVYMRNSGKAVLSYFFMSIVSYFAAFFGISRLFAVVDSVAEPELVALIKIVVIVTVTFLFIIMLQFGYSSMIFQMARSQEGKFSYIFTGFRNFSKTWFICLWYVILFGTIMCFSFYAATWIFNNYGESWFNVSRLVEEEKQLIAQAQEAAVKSGQTMPPVLMNIADRILYAMMILVFGVISLILLLPSVFTFCFRLDNGSKSSLYAFAASYRLSFSNWNIFRYIGFAFMGCWKNLLIALIAYIFQIIIMLIGGKSAAGNMIIQFICVINVYNAIAKIYMSIPIFYNEKTGVHKYKKVSNPVTFAMNETDSENGEQ